MGWKVELERPAEKTLAKLSSGDAQRIAAKLRELASLDNPRQRGIAMAGRHANHWRYRIGNYRVIARIEDRRMVILVVAIGHRREVYR